MAAQKGSLALGRHVVSTRQEIEYTAHAKEHRSGALGSTVIRDDQAGTLTTGLGREIERARLVLATAEAITGAGDFDRWRHEFWAWRTQCGATLHGGFEREAAAEFYRGTRIRDYPQAQWREARRAAVRAVEDMTQLLVTLRHTLSGQGAPKRRVNGSAAPTTAPREMAHG